MLVLVQVSSMKTRRDGIDEPLILRQRLRWRLMSGRSCSRATSVFF